MLVIIFSVITYDVWMSMVIRKKFDIVLYLNVLQNVHVSFIIETYIIFDAVMIY
jgi:hypothetical protein